MDIEKLKEIVKYKEEKNIKIEEVASYFGIGINRLRSLLKKNNLSFSKKRIKMSAETIKKIKQTNIVSKNSPYIKYDWKAEYDLFIKQNTEDKSLGIKGFCESRGYNDRYLRRYIRENNLEQPKGIPKRTQSWKSKISDARKGKSNNPKGSNGKLKGKKLSQSHRDSIREGLVRHYYDIPLDEWKDLQGEKEVYYREVWRITKQQPLETLENFDKRGNAGMCDSYQIDHIYPISKGFMNGIDPYEIGNIKNLQMLPWKENRVKGNNIIKS
jgi:hypothetical protein